MPNWCATNYLLRGNKDKVQEFCDKVNSCYDKPDIRPNSFGKLWLGNVCVAFGYEYDKNNGELRGCIDPDAGSVPCFCGPCIPEDKTEIIPTILKDKTTAVAVFSTQTAWGRSEWFENMIGEKYPELTLAWKATDEFGNFHHCHNPELIGCPVIEIEGWDIETAEFEAGKESEATDMLKNITGIDFTVEEILAHNEKMYEKIIRWNKQHANHEINVIVWEEV